MESSQTVWDRVDLPVLRFVAALDYNVRWQFDRRAPVDEFPELRGDELDAALLRLEEHALISVGQRGETVGYFRWSRLRPTPDGWRVLGEWPPSNESEIGLALVRLLRGLADGSDEPEAKPLRRAAGAVGRLAGDVVLDVAKSEIRHGGGELAT